MGTGGGVWARGGKTEASAAIMKRCGVERQALVIDLVRDANLSQSVRNLHGVVSVASGRLTARDVELADRVVVTRGAT